MDKDCRGIRVATRTLVILGAALAAAGMGCATSEQHISSTGGTTGSAGAGSAGTTGAAGTVGNGGAIGDAGTTGNGGATGVAGTTGAAGSAAGATGTAGTTGAGGAAGMAGATGSGGAGGNSAGGGGNTGRGGGGGGRGGTTGSAGTGGAGTAGSTGTGGGTGTGCAAAQICDDFESGSLSSTWKVSMNGGFTATIGTDQAHSGTHSLHIVAPNTSNSAFITETKTFPASDFWGRAWLRFNGPNGGHQMYIYVALSGDQLRLLNRLGSDAIQVNFQKTDQFYASKTTVPQTTWFCYEWHVTTSATTIYKDGVQLTDIKAPGITGGTSLSLGFQRFATATAAADLWIDDVAVNTSQIGCN